MKQLIIPIVIGLLAGIGGGTGYSYMKASSKYAADSTHLADSLKAHPPADSTSADSTHGEAAHGEAAHDSVPSDSASHGMDAPGSHEPDVPMTPADSIRMLDASRRNPKAAAAHAPATPSVKTPTPSATDAKPMDASATDAKAKATSAAAIVKGARDAAMQTALPEQRLAKIFSAMAAKDAAKVLDQMTDGDVRTILSMMSDRQAAAVLTSMSAARAAAITKGSPTKAPGGSQ